MFYQVFFKFKNGKGEFVKKSQDLDSTEAVARFIVQGERNHEVFKVMHIRVVRPINLPEQQTLDILLQRFRHDSNSH